MIEGQTIIISRFGEVFVELIKECTCFDSNIRPDAEQLKKHFLIFQKLMFFLLSIYCENYWNMEINEKNESFRKSFDTIAKTIKQYN